MFKGLDHTCITVGDLERSVAFYRDVLGFELITLDQDGGEETSRAVGVPGAEIKIALFKVGEGMLELMEYTAPRGKPYDRRNCDIGNMHLALRVDDCRQAYRELVAKGVRFNSPPIVVPEGPAKGLVWAYFSDPDGAQLEIVQQP